MITNYCVQFSKSFWILSVFKALYQSLLQTSGRVEKDDTFKKLSRRREDTSVLPGNKNLALSLRVSAQPVPLLGRLSHNLLSGKFLQILQGSTQSSLLFVGFLELF